MGIIARALYESLAASCAQALNELNRLRNTRLERIVMVGGGVRNGFFCQRVADACGVEVITGPAEATVAGNLFVQALALERILAGELGTVLEKSFEVRAFR